MYSRTLRQMHMEAKDLFWTGVQAADAYNKTRQSLQLNGRTLTIRDTLGKKIPFDLEGFKRIFLIGIGKAAGSMARAVEDVLQDRITDGIVNVPYGNRIELVRSRINETAHPLPDVQSLKGAQQIVQLAREAGENDLIICLLSGGGSALCTLPHASTTIQDVIIMNRQLLRSGANINEINTIRKHISQIKGGQLARFLYPATVVSLIISDVIADRLDSIASGPTAPDPTTFGQAYDVLTKYRLMTAVPETIRSLIQSGLKGGLPETPKQGDPAFSKTNNCIIAHNLDALRAINQKATQIGYRTLMLSSKLQGDTRNVARSFGAMIKTLISTTRNQDATCVISGGEMTVRVTGKGKGGRNCDFGLAMVPLISGHDKIVLLSAGTDGIDGPTDAAGTIIDNTTLSRMQNMGLDHDAALRRHDSFSAFRASGDLLVTGRTETNVMDIQLVLVDY